MAIWGYVRVLWRNNTVTGLFSQSGRVWTADLRELKAAAVSADNHAKGIREVRYDASRKLGRRTEKWLGRETIMDIHDVTARRVLLEPSIMKSHQTAVAESNCVESPELPIKGGLLQELQEPPGLTPKDLLREKAMVVGEAVNLLNRGLDYWVDEGTDKIVMQVVNRHTREVIRQVPAEEIVEISRRLQQLVGLIFDKET